MSVNSFVAQVAPMNLVAKVALQAQESPATKQVAMQLLLQETLAKEHEKVEKTPPGEAGQKIKPKQEGQKKNPEQQAGQHLTGERDELAELFEDSAGEPLGSVWSGNIVNVRI